MPAGTYLDSTWRRIRLAELDFTAASTLRVPLSPDSSIGVEDATERLMKRGSA